MRPKTEETLRGVGWSPDRQVDLTPFEKAYAEEGLTLHEGARKFLTEFGNLIISYQSEISYFGRSVPDVASFCVDEVSGWNHQWLPPDRYPGGIKHLCPIGGCWHDAILMMDETGRIWIFTIFQEPWLFATSVDMMLDLVFSPTVEDWEKHPTNTDPAYKIVTPEYKEPAPKKKANPRKRAKKP